MYPGKLQRPASFDSLERQSAFSMNRSVVTAPQKLPPVPSMDRDALAEGLADYMAFLIGLYADIYHMPEAYYPIHPISEYADRSKVRPVLNAVTAPLYALIGLFAVGQPVGEGTVTARQADFDGWCAQNCKPYKARQISDFFAALKRVGLEIERGGGLVHARCHRSPAMLPALCAMARIKGDRYGVNDLLRGNFAAGAAPSALRYLPDEAFDTLDEGPREMMRDLCRFMESHGLSYSCTRGGLPENGWYNAVYKMKRPAKTILGFNVCNAELQAVRVVGHNPGVILSHVRALPNEDIARVLEGCRCSGCGACEKAMVPEDKKPQVFRWDGGAETLCGNAFYFRAPRPTDIALIKNLVTVTLDSLR